MSGGDGQGARSIGRLTRRRLLRLALGSASFAYLEARGGLATLAHSLVGDGGTAGTATDASGAAGAARRLYRNVAIADGLSPQRQTAMSVLVDSGKVAWIRPSDAEGNPGPAAGLTIIDGNGMTAVPGLVDAHCHLTSPGGKNWLDHFKDPPSTMLQTAERNGDLARRAGTAWLREVGSPTVVDPIDGRRRALALGIRDRWAGRGDRPRVRSGGTWIAPPRTMARGVSIVAAERGRARRGGAPTAQPGRGSREAVRGSGRFERFPVERGGDSPCRRRRPCPRRQGDGTCDAPRPGKSCRRGRRRRRRARVSPGRRPVRGDGAPRHAPRHDADRAAFVAAHWADERRLLRNACRTAFRAAAAGARRAERAAGADKPAWLSAPARTSAVAARAPASLPGRSSRLWPQACSRGRPSARQHGAVASSWASPTPAASRRARRADFFLVSGDPYSYPAALWNVQRFA